MIRELKQVITTVAVFGLLTGGAVSLEAQKKDDKRDPPPKEPRVVIRGEKKEQPKTEKPKENKKGKP